MTCPGLVGPTMESMRMHESPPLYNLHPACGMARRHVKQLNNNTKWLAQLSSEKGAIKVNDNN